MACLVRKARIHACQRDRIVWRSSHHLHRDEENNWTFECARKALGYPEQTTRADVAASRSSLGSKEGTREQLFGADLPTVSSDPNIEELTELFALSDWYRSPLPKDTQNTLIA